MIQVGGTYLSFVDEKEDPLVGSTLAGYRVERRLGRGGMGTVYRATQISLERPVALKILSRDLAEDGEFVERFLKEARSAARLNHTHVVQVYNAGQEDSCFYLSMEFMQGGSLQGLLDRERKLAPGRIVPLILGAAKALVWAEQNGIVHRDIKPDNLMIDGEGNLKIGDFGIAADRRTSKTLYDGGKIVGTPHYMAPEQALGKRVDHRADIYALGSTLYTALSGTPPFEGETPTEVLLKKVKDAPPPLSKAAPDVPKILVGAVEKMMATDPEKRFQSAGEVLDVLSEMAKTLVSDEKKKPR
jgi:serine/threonine-protein kinase